MNKRIRKKHRIKEFYEPYLIIKGKFNRELTSDEVDEFVDSIIDFCDDYEDGQVMFPCGMTSHNDFNYSFCGGYKYRDRLTDKKMIDISDYITTHKFVNINSVFGTVLRNEEDENEHFKDL